jgi:hypothetical protein
MARPEYVVARTVVGSDDVIVVRVCEDRESAARYVPSDCRALEVFYRRATVAPKYGDRLPTWRDGSTRYAMAVAA